MPKCPRVARCTDRARTGGRDRQGRQRHVLASLLALTLTALALTGGYLGYIAARHARTITLPIPNGPYAIGRTIVDWTDQTRADPLSPHPASVRSLSVWLWYPAPTGTTAGPAPYAP